jgi:hypothetical protein
MKLRIKGNSLRLRVSRSELARFQAGGRIEETIHFTAAPEANLTYALESASEPSPVTVRYGSRDVTVILSKDRARIWGGTERNRRIYHPGHGVSRFTRGRGGEGLRLPRPERRG